MNSPLDHARALLGRARDDLYVMLAELLREAGVAQPPDAQNFGTLVPYGVVLRHEDVIADEAPPMDSDWLTPVVARTVAWADDYLNTSQD
jgi:hypothetical protein